MSIWSNVIYMQNVAFRVGVNQVERDENVKCMSFDCNSV
jgi:hypothetical protein